MGFILIQENGRRMRTPTCTSDNEPSLVCLHDALINFHKKLPLAGNPLNALLSLSDDLLTYLIAAIRNTPCPPPDLSHDDWYNFLALLHPHMIFPLITFHLRSWPEECRPPQEIMEYLNRVLLLAAARNLLAGRQIQSVTGALKDAGIPVILLKGHALARTVYPDPALRQSSDIDLLVQPHNIPASEEILEKLGYVCPVKTFHISQNEHHHEIFSPQGKGLHIELHWVTDNAFDLFPGGWLDDAFLRRIPIRSGDLSCDTFSHSDHLLYLAFHNVFQHWSMRLDWVYDISRMMREFTTQDDWKELGQQSVEHHTRIPMELSLTAASLWTGCGLPAGVENFSTWPVPYERELRLLKYSAAHHTSLYSCVYLIMQGQPGIREKLRYGWRFTLPPPALLYQYRRSPSPADIPLAYLRRWFSIVKYL
jgi:hypothetical protein